MENVQNNPKILQTKTPCNRQRIFSLKLFGGALIITSHLIVYNFIYEDFKKMLGIVLKLITCL